MRDQDVEEARADVSFRSGGRRCDGWLYRPAGRGPYPCVVMAHGFGGIRSAGLGAFATRFRAAGIAVLVFDYRHFGTSEGRPRGLIDIGRQREDYRAAVSFVRGLADVDAERVAVWGTSFSSGHALTLAAEDAGLAAAVLTNPYVDGRPAVRKSMAAASARVSFALFGRWLSDELRGACGLRPRRVDLVGEPGSVAAFTTSDAVAGYESILPTDRRGWEPAVPARILLRTALDRPAARAAEVSCPLQVCVCDDDLIAPVGAAVRVAHETPNGELRRYRLGHFDVFTGAGFDRVIADQVAFLRRHLVGSELVSQ